MLAEPILHFKDIWFRKRHQSLHILKSVL